jgi:hypothetical protein
MIPEAFRVPAFRSGTLSIRNEKMADLCEKSVPVPDFPENWPGTFFACESNELPAFRASGSLKRECVSRNGPDTHTTTRRRRVPAAPITTTNGSVKP